MNITIWSHFPMSSNVSGGFKFLQVLFVLFVLVLFWDYLFCLLLIICYVCFVCFICFVCFCCIWLFAIGNLCLWFLISLVPGWIILICIFGLAYSIIFITFISLLAFLVYSQSLLNLGLPNVSVENGIWHLFHAFPHPRSPSPNMINIFWNFGLQVLILIW